MEVEQAIVPVVPDAVFCCVLAPGNTLTARRTIFEAGDDLGRLLATVCNRWPKVYVLDFSRRRNIDLKLQDHLSDVYHSHTHTWGLKYYDIAADFPFGERDLWSRDGFYLSDNLGMPRLMS
ncbi:uncharacterized protein [Pagrus major]|uniref:uncharacterized protein isoform X2 n=1 Tax=Pagrus major TaxID=143350 RepID=UPI003CC8C2E5